MTLEELRAVTAFLGSENKKLSSLMLAKMNESYDKELSLQLIDKILSNAKAQLHGHKVLIEAGYLEYNKLKLEVLGVIQAYEHLHETVSS